MQQSCVMLLEILQLTSGGESWEATPYQIQSMPLMLNYISDKFRFLIKGNMSARFVKNWRFNKSFDLQVITILGN